MTTDSAQQIQAAELVLPCPDLDATLTFFTDRLGFRVDAIFPADDPSVVVISGYGLRIRLSRDGEGAPGALRLCCQDPAAVANGELELCAPNGTRVSLVAVDVPLELPPLQQSFVLTRLSESARWGVGRAGMRYRDLIPDRQGGRFIASHIQISGGGPVPDYVHFHKIRFQMIYCYKGWVRVVYEDQGPPFVLEAGDCVLQPPRIRHRVLESSPGLEVIEIGSPACHETLADHELSLPTSVVDRERDFGGQRFVRHEAAAAQWKPWRIEGFESRDIGMAAATDGLAGAQVCRLAGGTQTGVCSHDAEFVFLFVLQGATTLHCEGREAQQLQPGDSFVVPASMQHALTDCSDDVELLEVTLPAAFETVVHADATRRMDVR